MGWEITAVGLHLAVPELSAESMFHSVLGSREGGPGLGINTSGSVPY